MVRQGIFEDSGYGLPFATDDQYRRWRARHMAELDRDFAAFRAERAEPFPRAFDRWRFERRQPTGPSRRGESAIVVEVTRPEAHAPRADPAGATPPGPSARTRKRGSRNRR